MVRRGADAPGRARLARDHVPRCAPPSALPAPLLAPWVVLQVTVLANGSAHVCTSPFRAHRHYSLLDVLDSREITSLGALPAPCMQNRKHCGREEREMDSRCGGWLRSSHPDRSIKSGTHVCVCPFLVPCPSPLLTPPRPPPLRAPVCVATLRAAAETGSPARHTCALTETKWVFSRQGRTSRCGFRSMRSTATERSVPPLPPKTCVSSPGLAR